MFSAPRSEVSLNTDYKNLLEEKLRLNSRRIFSIYSRLFGGIVIFVILLLWRVDYDVDNINPKFLHAFEAVMVPAFLLYTFYFIKDMRTDVIELKKDIRNNKCKKLAFQAHKFYHALVNKYLLDYPGKEHMYIEVSPDDFNIIGDSETLYLITPIISSEIICLQKENGEIIRAFDFSFRNDRIPKGKP